MFFIKVLRAVAPLAILAGSQLGLYLVLREIFAPRKAEHARRRRVIFLSQLLLLLAMMGVFSAGKAGVVLPEALRWLSQILMAAFMLSLPALLVLGVLISLAQRIHHPPQKPAHPHTPADGSLEPISEPRRIFLVRAATGLFGGAAALAAAGIHIAQQEPLVTRREVPLPGLHPDLDGVTLLQLSDVHAGMMMTEERMAAIARAAAGLGADLIVFTGDLLDMSYKAAAPFSRAFGGLRGPLGAFAILGNHDYYAGAGAATRAVRDSGGTMLRNTGVRIQRGRGSLWLGGTDDPAGANVDFAASLKGAAPEEPRILLCHRPGLFPLCAKAGADLVLSGHTHGGQIALGPVLTPARLLGRYTMGYFREHGSQLYVHRGLGVVAGAPLRLGSTPEIALLTLRRS